jgi:tRNA A37 threonylcarbamoyladenosine synthetase subunit TsaC/SUA5/YrdC
VSGQRLLDQVFGFARVAGEQVTEAEQARQSRGDKIAEAVAAEVRAGQPSSVINLTSRELEVLHGITKFSGQLQPTGIATN